MSLQYSTLRKGTDNKFYVTNSISNEEEQVIPMFNEGWDCKEAYKVSGIKGYEPMTAKEIETEEQEDAEFANKENYIEEKFDGTRGLLHFFSQECLESGEVVDSYGWTRLFSRRISKKTDFYVENTDSVPHLRDIDVPELDGTVIDGELFIDGLPFNEVSSTLNCVWDKAVDRQIEKGFIVFHAFDILMYKGVDLRHMPLRRRKAYLRDVIEEAGSPYIKEVEYYSCGKSIDANVYYEVSKRIPNFTEDVYFDELEDNKDVYPNLYKCWKEDYPLTPRAYYELIVSTGGEGVIIKPKNGRYYHKRGREYQKIKKFLTREMILIDYEEPTKEYTGKDIKNWGYWEGNIPVTKHYYNKQIGNLVLGVVIDKEDIEKLPKNKKFNITSIPCVKTKDGNKKVIETCVCSGFDDEMRAYITRNKDKLIGSVVEVKCNEMFMDTGKMRHPRFLRFRDDKNAEQCTWKDHIGK